MYREQETSYGESTADGGQMGNYRGLGIEFYNKVSGGLSEDFRIWKSNDHS